MIDPHEIHRTTRLRQRLWGAAVLIALAVIFLPLLLDGSGSESQYRRVESLRAEPPRVVDRAGELQQLPVAQSASATSVSGAQAGALNAANPAAEADDRPVVIIVPEVPPPTPARAAPRNADAPTVATKQSNNTEMNAWVVQAGSFGDQQNAFAVRDRLRRAGFPSFVTPTQSPEPLYRVHVGPMINLQRAKTSRGKVMKLLNRDAIVVSYP